MWLRGQELRRNNEPSTGFCVATCGVVITALTVLLLHGLVGFGWKVELYLGSAMLVVFQVCALAACLVERKTKHRGIGLLISWLTVLSMIGSVTYGVMEKQTWAQMALRGLVVPTIAAGFVAAAITIRSQSHPRQRPWKAMLAIWLAPAVWQLILFCDDKLALGSKLTAVVAVLFGPWATVVAKMGSWPNAGEFFEFWPAMLLSFLLILVIFWMLYRKNRLVAGLMPSIYASSIVIWEILGIIQLVNCAE